MKIGLPTWIIFFIILPLLIAAAVFLYYEGELGLLV